MRQASYKAYLKHVKKAYKRDERVRYPQNDVFKYLNVTRNTCIK